MEELKRCPFCGGNKLHFEDGTRDEKFIYSKVVACYGCGTYGPDSGCYDRSEEKRIQAAIAAWNGRVEG